MKRILAITTLVLLTVGCNTITGTRTATDGSVLKLHSTRLFWSTGKASFALTNAEGVAVKLDIENSRADVEALKAVAEGVATGLAKGAVKGATGQ